MKALPLLLAGCLVACSSATPTNLPTEEKEEAPRVDGLDEPTVIEATRDERQSSFTCVVADTWGYPYLLEGDFEELSVWETNRDVCISTDGAAVDFCRWVNSFDERTRNLQACLKRARAELHSVGLATLRSRWRDVVRLLPPHWQIGNDEAEVGRVATWVETLRGRLVGDPSDFCLPAAAEKAPREQVISALQALRWAWQTLDAEQERIVGILRRGVRLNVEDETFDFLVNVVEDDPRRPTEERCSFQ